ncbi:MAG: gliding motility-associated C-terminal domain-containing protein, partial [Bacteroidota bacterium]
DFVGFVFGYQDPTGNTNQHKYWLFDWKQLSQTLNGFTAQEGKSLVQVDGNIPPASMFSYFWQHTSDPTFTVLDTDYGAGKGWAFDTDYQFTLIYTATNATIMIDGDTIFDQPGCYERGRFGFYNYSQADVVYSNFSYSLVNNFDILTPLSCPGDTAYFVFQDISCGGSVGSSNSNIASWNWDFDDGNTATVPNPINTFTQPGLYNIELIIQDINGCVDTLTKQMGVLPVPDVELGPDTVLCTGQTILLDANAGFPYANYQWQNNLTDSTQLVNTAGVYWAEASSFCGTDRDSITVGYLAPPSPVDLGPDTILCLGDSLNLNVSDPVASAYLWQDNSTLPSFDVPLGGFYYVSVSNRCGTEADSLSVTTVNPPQEFNLGPDQDLCQGDSLVLSQAQNQVDYLWQNNATDSVLIATQTGLYHLTVQNVCGVQRDSINLAFLAIPQPFDLGADTVLCDGSSLRLDVGQPDASYRWSNNFTGPVWTVTTEDLYTVTVGNICAQYSDSIFVDYLSPPQAFDLGSDTVLCEGNTLSLDVSQPEVQYIWQDGSTDPIYIVSLAGSYEVSLSNRCGSASDQIDIGFRPTPEDINLGADTTVCQEDELILDVFINDAGVEYMWQDGSTDAIRYITAPGLYQVMVSNACGIKTDEIQIQHADCDCTVFMGNAFTPNGDGINETFGASYDCEVREAQFMIFNRWGKMVFQSDQIDARWDGTINGRAAPEGAYVWVLKYTGAELDKTLYVPMRGSVMLMR